MLKELKFVQGAIASKDYVPALNHFRIANGRVEGFNGDLALSTPIDLDIVAMPKATPFVKAIERLPEGHEVVLNLTKGGKLTVKGGTFKVHVDCWPTDEGVPSVKPTGEIVPMPGGILHALKALAPTMGIDASRPWAAGILIRGGSAFATNNIVILEHWLGMTFPVDLNIPSMAIKEMIRINEEPISLQADDRSVTFHYSNGAWLRTSLLSGDWPDLARVLDQPANPIPFPPGFFEAVTRLDAFTEKVGKIYISPGVVATHPDEGVGALVEVPGLDCEGIYLLKQVASLEPFATAIDLGRYPLPALFFGDVIRGAIVGLRA